MCSSVRQPSASSPPAIRCPSSGSSQIDAAMRQPGGAEDLVGLGRDRPRGGEARQPLDAQEVDVPDARQGRRQERRGQAAGVRLGRSATLDGPREGAGTLGAVLVVVLAGPGPADHDLVLLDRDLDGAMPGPVLCVDGVVLDRGVEPQSVALLAVVERRLQRLGRSAATTAATAASAARALGRLVIVASASSSSSPAAALAAASSSALAASASSSAAISASSSARRSISVS